MRYFFPCLMFLANNEVISWLALLILFGIFLLDCWRARPNYGGDSE